MSSVLQDLRLAWRQVRKDLGFTVTVVLTVALGIGAATAIFSLVDAVWLRPLPFPGQDRLVWLQQRDRSLLLGADAEPLSYPDYFDWRAQSHSFIGLASYRHRTYTLTGTGAAQQLTAIVVSANFFRVLGVHPMLGRSFLPEEEKPGSHIAILSSALWQSAFAGARDIGGRAITLDGERYTVAGVIPADATFPIEQPAPALWTTLGDDAEGKSPRSEQRGNDGLDLLGRLRPGVSVEQARAETSAIARRIALQFPDTNATYDRAIVMPLLDKMIGDFRPALRVLFLAVLLVLLIACANVAGLLLARASRRRAEVAVRVALGAGRWRVARQALAESILLAGCGGAAGVLLASWTLEAMLRFVPAALPRAGGAGLDGTVLAFAITLSLLAGLLFGTVPAWRMAAIHPAAALRDNGRGITSGRRQNRLQAALVIGEIALGLLLLTGAGLLIRSFIAVVHVDPGFDRHGVLTASIYLPGNRYDNGHRLEFYDSLLGELRALPGVESASAAYPMPMGTGSIGVSFQIIGREVPSSDEPSEHLSVVLPGFFHTLHIPVVAGREFDARDKTHSAPVILISRSFARKYFPGENPLGQRIKSDLGDGEVISPVREVVGVVGDVHRKELTKEAEPQYYLPFSQAAITSPTLAIRTAGDPALVAGAVRKIVAALDPDVPVSQTESLDRMVSAAAAQPWFHALLLTSFAVIALLLLAVGLYATLAYMVAQRTAELGLRAALGARGIDLVHLVLGRGLALAAGGIVLGMAASFAATRYLSTMLYGVQPLDAATFAAAPAVLLGVAAVASAIPAWRAARLNPVDSLRDQ
jgi:putative ABC transport system permease protein